MEDFLLTSSAQPVISLNLTEEEVNACKEKAYTALLNRFPSLNSKTYRCDLNPLDQLSVVNSLTRAYMYFQTELLETKKNYD